MSEASPFSMPCMSVVMGSEPDYEVMKECAAILKRLHVPFEARVIFAAFHRQTGFYSDSNGR